MFSVDAVETIETEWVGKFHNKFSSSDIVIHFSEFSNLKLKEMFLNNRWY
jgi:hypothetical protein